MLDMQPEIRGAREKLDKAVPFLAPKVVFVDVCDKCNFKCSFCPCNNSVAASDLRHKMMDFSLFKEIVDGMKEFNGKIRVVNLYTFGESLLHPDFPKFLRYLRKKDVCDEIRLTSNGSLLNPALNQQLVDGGLNMFRLSLYGLNNEDYLKHCGVKFDLDKLLKNIGELKRMGLGKLKISIKATSAFIDSDEKYQLFSKMVAPIADYWYVENISKIWYGFDGGIDCGNIEMAVEKWHSGGKTTICDCPFTTMMIFSNGDVGLCSNDWLHGTKYASIKEHSVKEVWNSKELRGIQLDFLHNKQSPFESCKSCKYISIDKIDDDSCKKMIQRLKSIETIAEC
jgi:MoaA/NifB/PqqE/SkfB family radical SAM enzyme